MGNRDLIPEARADKNGRIVVRWIRRMFGADKKASAIPKVSLLSRYSDVSERMEIRDRLIKKYPETEYVPQPDGNMEHYPRVAERRAIDRAFEDRDLTKLKLMDQYLGKYEGGIISGVLNHLRDMAGDETSVEVDDTLLSAYASFHEAIPFERVNVQGEHNDLAEISRIGKYVLTHPEDSPLVNMVIARGVIECDEVIKAVEALKNSDVPSVINEGFL